MEFPTRWLREIPRVDLEQWPMPTARTGAMSVVKCDSIGGLASSPSASTSRSNDPLLPNAGKGHIRCPFGCHSSHPANVDMSGQFAFCTHPIIYESHRGFCQPARKETAVQILPNLKEILILTAWTPFSICLIFYSICWSSMSFLPVPDVAGRAGVCMQPFLLVCSSHESRPAPMAAPFRSTL